MSPSVAVIQAYGVMLSHQLDEFSWISISVVSTEAVPAKAQDATMA
jgi:hypothetical protein